MYQVDAADWIAQTWFAAGRVAGLRLTLGHVLLLLSFALRFVFCFRLHTNTTERQCWNSRLSGLLRLPQPPAYHRRSFCTPRFENCRRTLCSALCPSDLSEICDPCA